MLRKIALIGLLTLCCQAQNYAMTVVIDAGHGGTGARKFGSNGGDGNGAAGPVDTLTEQWVNLRVALIVGDIMDGRPPEPTVVQTRPYDTTNITINRRVQKTKDNNANYFISIHHNGLPLNTQWSEVWWDSTRYTDDSNLVRVPEARDSIFAKKTLLRIRDMWYYANHCSSMSVSNWMQGCNSVGMGNFALLHRTRHCPCILSEASNLVNDAEEAAFADEYNPHAGQEADAVYHGWHSYYANMGIAQISNRCLGNVTATVLVDTMLWSAPVEFCWEALEQHYLQAAWDFWENGYYYTFHHWAHYTAPPFSYPAEVNFARFWTFSVNPEWDFHIYRAYFTGGPYGCSIYEPQGNNTYRIGDTLQIIYDCSPGVDYTSMVDVYLDRHNGHSGYPETFAQNVPYADGVRWVIDGPESDSCLMKVAIHDFVGNSASTISNPTFKIHTSLCTSCGDADGNGTINISDAVFLIAYINAHGIPPGDCNYSLGKGDADGNRIVNISDVVYLIAYAFSHGPAPHCQGM